MIYQPKITIDAGIVAAMVMPTAVNVPANLPPFSEFLNTKIKSAPGVRINKTQIIKRYKYISIYLIEESLIDDIYSIILVNIVNII